MFRIIRAVVPAASDTISSGGPVINAAGDIVGVVSQGGGVPSLEIRQQGVGYVAVGGDVVELAKTRQVKFLRDDHGTLA